jgi:hypothetical protein
MVEQKKNVQECVEGINTMQIPGGLENGDDGDRDTAGVKEVANHSDGMAIIESTHKN